MARVSQRGGGPEVGDIEARTMEGVNTVLGRIGVDVQAMGGKKGGPAAPQNCFGTFGTFGCVGGCCGTCGTYGCARPKLPALKKHTGGRVVKHRP